MSDPLASLQRLVGAGSAESGCPDAALLDRVVELYALTEDQRSETDSDAFGSVMERIAYAAPLEKRAWLANRLARDGSAPRQLLRRLAFDTILVARPVLQYSIRLNDRDLVTLVAKLEEDHRIAIAHRLTLAKSVTDALIARGGPAVHITVVQNMGAVFSEDGIARLTELAEKDPALRQALSRRPDLNPGLLQRLVAFVSDSILSEFATLLFGAPESPPPPDGAEQQDCRAPGPPADSAGSRAKAPGDAEAGPAAPAARRSPEPPPEGFHVSNGGKATERALTEMARVGWVSGTIGCMAKLTGLDEDMTEHCLLRADLPALMVLCKAHRFSNATFGALLQFREAKGSGGAIDTVGLLKRYDAMQSHTAKRIIQFAEKKNHAVAEANAN